MGQVRWAGWTMAIATALVISGGQVARADIASDKPAAIVLYPDIKVSVVNGVDTEIRLTNTNQTTALFAHCFFVDANSHCAGGVNEGAICTSTPTACVGGLCTQGWNETDFNIVLTPKQPITWRASTGLADLQVPIPTGVCKNNPFITCSTDLDCNPFPGGTCTASNIGTRIPPVPEAEFAGELKCITVDANGTPVPNRNDLKGEAILETVTNPGTTAQNFDVASYNAIGIQATGNVSGSPNELILDSASNPDREYNGCPNFLILDHFFDGARDPIPGSANLIATNLVLVPCSEDLLRQIPGAAVVQYLVFNEFEQRFSTSTTVRCFQDIQLCDIGGGQCNRSIFNVAVAGTLTGQTRMQPLGIPPLPSGLLGIAVERHIALAGPLVRSAAFNLQMSGERDSPDVITIP